MKKVRSLIATGLMALAFAPTAFAQEGPVAFCKRDCELKINACEARCEREHTHRTLNMIHRPAPVARDWREGLSNALEGLQELTIEQMGKNECDQDCSSLQEQCEFDCEARFGEQ